jgi:methylmalonyl-CoA mutase cobalamin-binding subunit
MQTDFKRLDVCAWIARGEEPFSRVRAAVHALGAEEGLLLVAPFLPAPLIDWVKGEGFETKIEPGTKGRWLVRIWRETAGAS